jgi:hypothetical protein
LEWSFQGITFLKESISKKQQKAPSKYSETYTSKPKPKPKKIVVQNVAKDSNSSTDSDKNFEDLIRESVNEAIKREKELPTYNPVINNYDYYDYNEEEEEEEQVSKNSKKNKNKIKKKPATNIAKKGDFPTLGGDNSGPPTISKGNQPADFPPTQKVPTQKDFPGLPSSGLTVKNPPQSRKEKRNNKNQHKNQPKKPNDDGTYLLVQADEPKGKNEPISYVIVDDNPFGMQAKKSQKNRNKNENNQPVMKYASPDLEQGK